MDITYSHSTPNFNYNKAIYNLKLYLHGLASRYIMNTKAQY